MCLAVPARVTSVVPGALSEVDILGVSRNVSLEMTPEANVGDWVLVHAGFAIQIVDEAFAHETLELLKECNVVEDEVFDAAMGRGAYDAAATGS